MIRRNTWIVLVIFILLLAFAWYWQTQRPETAGEGTPTAESQAPLITAESSQVRLLGITTPSGRMQAVREADNQWQLVEPDETVDPGAVEQLISQLNSITVRSTLESNPPLEATGFITPTGTIQLEMADGKRTVILVGGETPTGSGYYVQKDGGKIQVVSQFGIDTLLEAVDNPPALRTPTPEVTVTPTEE